MQPFRKSCGHKIWWLSNGRNIYIGTLYNTHLRERIEEFKLYVEYIIEIWGKQAQRVDQKKRGANVYLSYAAQNKSIVT